MNKSPVIPPYDTRTKFIDAEKGKVSDPHEKWLQQVGVKLNTSLQIATAIPATPVSPGTQGTTIVTAQFVYFCIAANSWVRGVVSTW